MFESRLSCGPPQIVLITTTLGRFNWVGRVGVDCLVLRRSEI